MKMIVVIKQLISVTILQVNKLYLNLHSSNKIKCHVIYFVNLTNSIFTIKIIVFIFFLSYFFFEYKNFFRPFIFFWKHFTAL